MTYFNDPPMPRFELPDDNYSEPEKDYCGCCDTFFWADEGEVCECHCQKCGEELPEADDAHCTNCCECDACALAEELARYEFLETSFYPDMPIITGKKVFTRYPR